MQDWDAASLLALTAAIESDGTGETRPFSQRFVRRLLSLGALSGGVFNRDAVPAEKEMEKRICNLLTKRDAAVKLISRYRDKGFQILLPSDPDWPDSLNVLGSLEPLYLFIAGNRGIFRVKNISAAGSRDVGRQAAEAAREIGESAAAHRCVLVSGNARGIDRICQKAAMQTKGKLLIFPASRLDIWKQDHALQTMLEVGDLLVASETLPDEPFSAPKALSRNHLIYAIGDPAVVIAARSGKGGSWRGAMDCLSHGWTEVMAVTGAHEDFTGCRALIKHGAFPLELKPGTLWNQIEERCRNSRRQKEKQVQLKWKGF